MYPALASNDGKECTDEVKEFLINTQTSWGWAGPSSAQTGTGTLL